MAGALRPAAPAEIELIRIQGEPHYRLTSISGERQLVHADSLEPVKDPMDPVSILAELERTVTDADIVDHAVLDRYDAYYYSRTGAAPLPALRVRFNDSAATWYYFDLMTGEAVYANHGLGRLERWLFNGLHSLDFGFWYGRRPLWDIGMILLSLGALATSGIGMYLGARRLLGKARSA